MVKHRNLALAAARRARAVELRTTGLTYDQIAKELECATSAGSLELMLTMEARGGSRARAVS